MHVHQPFLYLSAVLPVTLPLPSISIHLPPFPMWGLWFAFITCLEAVVAHVWHLSSVGGAFFYSINLPYWYGNHVKSQGVAQSWCIIHTVIDYRWWARISLGPPAPKSHLKPLAVIWCFEQSAVLLIEVYHEHRECLVLIAYNKACRIYVAAGNHGYSISLGFFRL